MRIGPLIIVACTLLAVTMPVSAQCNTGGPVPTCIRTSRRRCEPINDPVAHALLAAQDLADALDSIGYYNDAASLRLVGFDGTIECSAYGMALIDEAVRHTRETWGQHGSEPRVRPVVDALASAAAQVHAVVDPALASSRRSGMAPVVFSAGIAGPAMTTFPTLFTMPVRTRWIAIRRPRARSRE